MRYAKINKLDISNGIGIGMSLFLQGCKFHCKNCFNPETWDLDGGKLWTQNVENQFLDMVKTNIHADRLSILGGEPLLYPLELKELITKVKTLRPDIKIWIYSGYTFEAIKSKSNSELFDVIKLCDVLVDGQYKDELKDYTLRFRGSSNQHIIDIQMSIKNNLTTYYIL